MSKFGSDVYGEKGAWASCYPIFSVHKMVTITFDFGLNEVPPHLPRPIVQFGFPWERKEKKTNK